MKLWVGVLFSSGPYSSAWQDHFMSVDMSDLWLVHEQQHGYIPMFSSLVRCPHEVHGSFPINVLLILQLADFNPEDAE